MYLHNKNNMRHFCITNKKKQKTSGDAANLLI